MLQNLYGSDPFAASIVIVIHSDAIPLFAKRGRKHHQDLANHAQGLTLGEVNSIPPLPDFGENAGLQPE